MSLLQDKSGKEKEAAPPTKKKKKSNDKDYELKIFGGDSSDEEYPHDVLLE